MMGSHVNFSDDIWINIMLQFSKLTGLWATGKNHLPFVAVTIFLNILDAIFKYYVYMWMMARGNFKSKHYLEVCRNVLSKTTLICHWVMLYKYRKEFSRLRKITRTSHALRKYKTSSRQKTTFFKIILVAVYLQSHRIVSLCVLEVALRDIWDLLQSLTFLFSNFCEFVIMLQFLIFLHLLKSQMEIVNEKLALMKFDFDRFEFVLAMMKKLNGLYGLQNLLLITQIFVILVNMTYSIIVIMACDQVKSCPEELKAWAVSYFMSNNLFALFMLVCLVQFCQSSSNVVNSH